MLRFKIEKIIKVEMIDLVVENGTLIGKKIFMVKENRK